MLKHIISNAERNASKVPKVRRHSEVLKKFCTSLLIYAGPIAYEFLQQKLPQALPCLWTVQHVIHSEYKTIVEGDFRIDDLLHHINQYKAPMMVTIWEDATRVDARVEYDCLTDSCVGFVLPIAKNGLPILDSFIALPFSTIKNMFSSNQIAKYAYVYMAQLLGENVPAHCLACIGTNNRFTYETVLNRWKYKFEQCKKRNVHVISLGGDRDSCLMSELQQAC